MQTWSNCDHDCSLKTRERPNKPKTVKQNILEELHITSDLQKFPKFQKALGCDYQLMVMIRQTTSAPIVTHSFSTAYCLEVIELPFGQFEFKLRCYDTKESASPL